MRVEWGDADLGIMGFMRIVGIMGNIGASWDGSLGLHVAVVMGNEVRSRRKSTTSTTNTQIGLMGLIGLIFQYLACR